MSAGYLRRFSEGVLDKQAKILAGITKKCALCPRECGIDRTRGERGFCRLTDKIIMSHALPHYGEEPPVSGKCGAGTIFFSSCNLRCIYCQNYRISHGMMGRSVDPSELSRAMLELQENGCHNIELVSPTPHIHCVLEALSLACADGLHIPLVYNCSGYDNPDIIEMLDGIVDIYLPDFKYGTDKDSFIFSGVMDYVSYALGSIKKMVGQVGDALETENGIARRGIIIRHLVLPGSVTNSLRVLDLLKEHISTTVPISIMAQYEPIPSVTTHPLLCRKITNLEYETVVNYAVDLGFEYIFIQDSNDDRTLIPDFERNDPFAWVNFSITSQLHEKT
ncbi:MAG: radical SAM protein [Deltaproteobacteria bacterium]|nr:radical SAM protein [Deltaproteobacteria bacterium]